MLVAVFERAIDGLLADMHRVTLEAANGLDSLVPAVTEKRALARVEAVFGLLNSVPNLSSALSDDELRVELRVVALAGLTAPATTADR